jgi:putative membrane protein
MNPDVSHMELGKDLANRQGADFDRRYVQAMQEDQRREVDLLKASRVSVSDERLKAFIRDALPVAEEHSRMADRLTIE